MSKWKQYPAPPIAEALVDIQVVPGENVALSDCESFRDELYPNVERRHEATGTLLIKDGEASATSSHRQVGFIYANEGRTLVFQMRPDRFTLSRLPPYQSWDQLITEAQRIWQRYCEITRPASIARVAVRVINRIELPAARVNLEDYFRLFPEIPKEMPPMIGFLNQSRFLFEEIETAAIVNQTWLTPNENGFITVTLDIDIFRKKEVPVGDGLWDFMNVLHDKRNFVFEACITDKCRELFR